VVSPDRWNLKGPRRLLRFAGISVPPLAKPAKETGVGGTLPQRNPEVNVTRFWRSLLLVPALTLTLTARAGENPLTTQWVLAVVNDNGANGEKYVSSLRIVNANTTAATVSMTFYPQSPFSGGFSGYSATGDNSAVTPVTVSVPANRTLALEDVVVNNFSGASPFGVRAGGIRIESNVPVSVLSRTYVANAQNAAGKAGTFGLQIPGQGQESLIYPGDTAYVSYTSSAPDRTEGFRSNFIILNTAGGSATIQVEAIKGDGGSLGTRQYTLAPFASAQALDIASNNFGYSTRDENLTLVVKLTSGGPVLTGMTIIDNAIASINYAPPSKKAVPYDGAFGLIFDDGGYGFSGRLDFTKESPDFLSAGIVVTNCTGPDPVKLFFVQGFGTGESKNTNFSKNPDGTFAFTGNSATANWTGSIVPQPDGTVLGSVTYSRTQNASDCPGISRELSYKGSKGASFSTP
jgi:hypothetical protein